MRRQASGITAVLGGLKRAGGASRQIHKELLERHVIGAGLGIPFMVGCDSVQKVQFFYNRKLVTRQHVEDYKH